MLRTLAAVATALSLITGPVLAQQAATTPVAPVPSPVVVFILEQLVSDTVAGKDMGTKINAIAQGIQTELQAEAQAINTERNRLLGTPQNQTQTAPYRQAEQALAIRFRNFEGLQQRRELELRATRERALLVFSQALDPILKQVMETRNALVVLERGSIAYAVPGVDITADLIRSMDASVSTINVAQVRIQTEAEAAAQQAQQGQENGAALPPRPPVPVPVPR